jgi:hypothetical protein
MESKKYVNFIVIAIISWAFIAIFIFQNVSMQKIYIEQRKLEFEEWKSNKPSFRELGSKQYSPEKVYQIIKLDNPAMPLVRVNQQTGQVEYWSIEAGGWVNIQETSLVTAEPTIVRKQKVDILNNWYDKTSLDFKVKVSRELFQETYATFPMSNIEYI